jgi:hypothetical protein
MLGVSLKGVSKFGKLQALPFERRVGGQRRGIRRIYKQRLCAPGGLARLQTGRGCCRAQGKLGVHCVQGIERRRETEPLFRGQVLPCRGPQRVYSRITIVRGRSLARADELVA